MAKVNNSGVVPLLQAWGWSEERIRNTYEVVIVFKSAEIPTVKIIEFVDSKYVETLYRMTVLEPTKPAEPSDG